MNQLSSHVGRVVGRAGHSALVGVLTVIDEEFKEIQPLLGTTENLVGTRYYVRPGQGPKHYDVVMAQLEGRGNVKCSTGATALIETFRPPFILLVGIAGGVEGRDGTSVGDVVIPDFIENYDMRKMVDGKSLRRSEPCDHPSLWLRLDITQPIAREAAWRKCIDAARVPEGGTKEPKVIFGNLISGDKVLGDDEAAYQRDILTEYDKALAVDMESWGLASQIFSMRSHRHYNPQYLVIRGISDTIREPSKVQQGTGSQPQTPEGEEKSLRSHDLKDQKLTNNQVRQLWKPYAAHVAGALAAEVIKRVLTVTKSFDFSAQAKTEV